MTASSDSKTSSGNPALTLRDVAPAWAQVSDKLTELCLREDEIITEMMEIRQRVEHQAVLGQHTILPYYFRERPKKWADTVITTSSGAAALLGDLTPEPKVIEGYEERVGPDAQKNWALHDELVAVREAISVIRDKRPGERHSLWERTRLEGSKAYCDKIAPEYESVARAYLDALIALGAAHVAHERFVKERLTGVAHASLRPIVPVFLFGDPSDKTSPIRAALERAVDLGRLESEAIPPQWNRPEQ